jgi:hypothetical protein
LSGQSPEDGHLAHQHQQCLQGKKATINRLQQTIQTLQNKKGFLSDSGLGMAKANPMLDLPPPLAGFDLSSLETKYKY